jgi:hypothetical protein
MGHSCQRIHNTSLMLNTRGPATLNCPHLSARSQIGLGVSGGRRYLARCAACARRPAAAGGQLRHPGPVDRAAAEQVDRDQVVLRPGSACRYRYRPEQRRYACGPPAGCSARVAAASPVAASAVALRPPRTAGRRQRGSATARPAQLAACRMSTTLPARSDAGPGRAAVTAAWARWRAPRTRRSRHATGDGAAPVSRNSGAGTHTRTPPQTVCSAGTTHPVCCIAAFPRARGDAGRDRAIAQRPG